MLGEHEIAGSNPASLTEGKYERQEDRKKSKKAGKENWEAQDESLAENEGTICQLSPVRTERPLSLL